MRVDSFRHLKGNVKLSQKLIRSVKSRGHVILNSNTHYTLEVKRDRETQPDSFRQTRGHVKLSQKLIRSVSCKGP